MIGVTNGHRAYFKGLKRRQSDPPAYLKAKVKLNLASSVVITIIIIIISDIIFHKRIARTITWFWAILISFSNAYSFHKVVIFLFILYSVSKESIPCSKCSCLPSNNLIRHTWNKSYNLIKAPYSLLGLHRQLFSINFLSIKNLEILSSWTINIDKRHSFKEWVNFDEQNSALYDGAHTELEENI